MEFLKATVYGAISSDLLVPLEELNYLKRTKALVLLVVEMKRYEVVSTSLTSTR